ncbi:hypothetical protein DL89DRAFT_319992 [Linderina pennispora]|uniref:HMG box domain-containing protein n=1 Tax=Linderina pennispora TaxID=61395 RepID=A0A1Y1WMX9_9FUNG|nr:uncharacterized protein DL89DRAFT_319992 [Linderina pennispora]ORX74464.1 hypothetical protein DL89DRAFT_319992 [Linderina pennispora]
MARNQATQPNSQQRSTSTGQQSSTPRRREPLALLNIDGKQFLEIRQGYSPIMVPSHMLDTVRTVLSEHLRRYLNAQQPQVSSPPQSPPHIASTPSHYVATNPSAEEHTSPSLAMVPPPPPQSSGMTMTAQPHTPHPAWVLRRGSVSSHEGEDMDVASNFDDDSEEEELKKPANAFILRKLSVEVASTMISKCWHNEQEAHADRYFAKKKRILARQKLRKDREDAALLGASKTLPLQPRRTPSGSQFASQCLQHSASFSSEFNMGMQQQPPPPLQQPQHFGLERAMTHPTHSDMSSSLLTSSVADTASLVTGISSSSLTPGMGAMGANGFNLGLNTNGSMLSPMGFSQTMDPSLTHFKSNYHNGLDNPLAMTSATLTPTLQSSDPVTAPASSAWPIQNPPLDDDSWTMISSLIQSSGVDTNAPLATPYVEDQRTL